MAYKIYRMTDAEYDRLLQEHRMRTRKSCEVKFDIELAALCKGKTPLRTLSAATGLSTATLSRYRNKGWGSRGPLFTTYEAMCLARRGK